MTRVAVFPGQGAQALGMGRALHDGFPEARAVFDEVDAALGERLSAVIFTGPADALTLTANAQPALMATSLAAVRAVEAATGRRLAGDIAAYVAGHSLGEYSALAAAGALGIADAARLLRLRGEAMQAAVPAGEGAMAALLGVEPEVAAEVAAEAAAEGGVCELANDNADGQAVLSGHKATVERAIGIAKARGARRAVLLQVSAPFHCALMTPAAERLAEALARVRIERPAVPVIANVTAAPESEPETIRALLARQVTARVRWRESMAAMSRLGVDGMVELGAGKVLTGLARRALPGAALHNVQDPDEVEGFAVALRGMGAAA